MRDPPRPTRGGAVLPLTPTGRHTLAIVQPVHITSRPPWAAGPLPLHVDDLTATIETRSTYFSPPCNRILYGTRDRPTRWHLPIDNARDDGLFGSELLLPDPEDDPHLGLAILHIATPEPAQLDLLRAAAGRRNTTAALPDLAGLVQPFAEPLPGEQLFTVAFKTTAEPLQPPRGTDERLGWSPAQAWLWHLGSRSTSSDYPPDPEFPDRALTGTVVLSADWRGLVTRDGAAFVALRPDRGADDPFLAYAHLYTHTTYLDALLLGMAQRASVERMILESAAAFDATNMQRHLERLEQRAARVRTIYWLRDASTHGHANGILDAYHAQHELPERFAAVISEIADLARTVQAREADRIGAALGVLTTVGLPFGAALETLQVLNANSLTDLAIGLGAALATTTGLLTTRIGQLLVHQIRQLK